MNNEKKLYEICLKMIKDKHQLNEYPIDKFNTFYFQVFNNINDNDNINDLNKIVLKKINEDIIFNSTKNNSVENKIIELLKTDGAFLDQLDLGPELFNNYQSFVLDRINLDIKSFSAYSGGLDAIHVHKFIESIE